MEFVKLNRKKKEKEHECKRFKTVMKREGIRHIVACRECGEQRLVAPMHDIAGPKADLK